jgi:hypothetical protein
MEDEVETRKLRLTHQQYVDTIAKAIYEANAKSPPAPRWENASKDVRDWSTRQALAALKVVNDYKHI